MPEDPGCTRNSISPAGVASPAGCTAPGCMAPGGMTSGCIGSD